jgi:hypothetical protein
MRMEVCVVMAMLVGCVSTPDVVTLRPTETSIDGAQSEQPYSIKDGVKDPDTGVATPKARKKAEAFCAKQAKVALSQRQTRPSGDLIFTCVPLSERISI